TVHFVSWRTILGGLFLLITAAVSFWATYKKETYTPPQGDAPKYKEFFIFTWWINIISSRQQAKLGTILFGFAYLAANLGIFIAFYLIWKANDATAQVQAQMGLLNPLFVNSLWVPTAKGF